MAVIQKMPAILTLPEAAAYLRLSQRTMWELVRKGAVPSFRLGRQHRFSLTALEQWADRECAKGEVTRLRSAEHRGASVEEGSDGE